MTELSRVWDDVTPGDGTDAPYTSSEFSEILQALAAAEAVPTNKSGVFRGVDNILGYTIGANKVTIGTGKALTAGRYYKNTAPVDVSVPTATTGRRDRIVLRRDTTAQTVRLTRIAGIDNGSGVAPAITQNASTWDEPLYIFNIAAGGVITLITDEREYLPRHGDVSGEGSAAAHAWAQISGRPVSADSAPVNAGLTKTANAGSDTGHYANDDHVHKVDPIPSAIKTANEAHTSVSNDSQLFITLEAGVAYIIELALGMASSDPPGTMFTGSFPGIGSFSYDTSVTTGAFLHTGIPAGAGGVATLSFGPSPAIGNSVQVNAGSWVRATPVT